LILPLSFFDKGGRRALVFCGLAGFSIEKSQWELYTPFLIRRSDLRSGYLDAFAGYKNCVGDKPSKRMARLAVPGFSACVHLCSMRASRISFALFWSAAKHHENWGGNKGKTQCFQVHVNHHTPSKKNTARMGGKKSWDTEAFLKRRDEQGGLFSAHHIIAVLV